VDCERMTNGLSVMNKSIQVFGNNYTRVVGLTDALYAITDGVNIQYFSQYDDYSSMIVRNAWLVFQIDFDSNL
jgi:hypothetical protein